MRIRFLLLEGTAGVVAAGGFSSSPRLLRFGSRTHPAFISHDAHHENMSSARANRSWPKAGLCDSFVGARGSAGHESLVVTGVSATSLAQQAGTYAESPDAAVPLLAETENSPAMKNGDRCRAEFVDTVICGAGPAGLLAAIMMAQKFPNNRIRVYDRLSPPSSPDDSTVWDDVAKFYLIGIGGRGQAALKKFGVWDDVLKRGACAAYIVEEGEWVYGEGNQISARIDSDLVYLRIILCHCCENPHSGVPVLGRKDWQPNSKEGVERIFTTRDKHVTTVVMPRDKLVGVLMEFITRSYREQIDLCFNSEVQPTDWAYKDGTRALVKVYKCEEMSRLNPSSVKTAFAEQPDVLSTSHEYTLVETNFLIAADGTVRTIANSIARSDARRVKKMNPLRRVLEHPFRVRRYADDNQRVYKTVPLRMPDGWRKDLNYSARTAEGRVNFDALPANSNGDYCGVLLLRNGDAMARETVDSQEFRQFLDSALPQFSELLDDETVARVAQKPVSYLPGFRYSGPRLHQGSCCVLLGDSAHTVKPYFGLGANSALEDVSVLSDVLDNLGEDYGTVTREYSNRRAKEAKTLVRLSRELDRPGKVGFLTFILPLILDSIFHGLAPTFFSPNIITMLQREQYTFRQVAARKRIDRINQLASIGMFMTCSYCLVSWTLTRLTGILGSRPRAAALFSACVVAAKFASGPLGAITSRFSKKITNSRTFLTPLRNVGRESRNGETFLTSIGNNDKVT